MAFWSGLRRLGRNRHYHRGIVHYNRGEYVDAVAAFEEALEAIANPQDPEYSLGSFYAAEARANLGLARFQKGDDARAEEDFRRALERNPNYPDLHYYLALICERTGRPAEAAGELESALAVNSEYLEARLLMAVVLSQMGHPARARIELERAVGLGFELPPGLSLETSRPLGPAEWEVLRSRATRRSEASRQLALAVEHYEQGRRAEAIQALERAVEAEPRFPDVRCRLAVLLTEAARYEEALGQLDAALERNPRYLEARVRHGLTLVALGRPIEAEADFQAALAQEPEYP